MKKLADFSTEQRIKRPQVPVVPMQLSDDEATHRLVVHATKRVIKQHYLELEKLAYR